MFYDALRHAGIEEGQEKTVYLLKRPVQDGKKETIFSHWAVQIVGRNYYVLFEKCNDANASGCTMAVINMASAYLPEYKQYIKK